MNQNDPSELPLARLHPATSSVRKDRTVRGRMLQSKVPVTMHASLNFDRDKVEPIAYLDQYNKHRIRILVPIRWGRMMRSPFCFFRGAAALMAADLARTTRIDLLVQACGDCHVLNFGAFGSPERNIVFDITDFDETLPAPWEWDLKRLASSFVLIARENSVADEFGLSAALAAARSYRETIAKYAEMSIREVWHSRIDWTDVVSKTQDRYLAEARQARLRQAIDLNSQNYVSPKLIVQQNGFCQLRDNPPVMYHPKDHWLADEFRLALPMYRQSLQEDKQRLFDRHKLQDIAVKVVGIGSVGTMCAIALFLAPDNEILLLKIKEASRSVLEAYAGKSEYANSGQRVVAGQRIAQSASDTFLGWTCFPGGRHFYIQQLRDTKVKPEVDLWTGNDTVESAILMGAALARAHARSGDAAVIAGYLGDNDSFDQAISEFAIAYANQTEKDHFDLVKAVNSGRIIVADDAFEK